MCAIIDANVVGEVFGPNPTEAGKEFRAWIIKGSGRLISGGKLREELDRIQSFKKWAFRAGRTGKIKNINEEKVKRRMAQIQKESILSDDPHILALAQVSGARLLYSNDTDLHKDFKNKDLGFIYSTLRSKKFTPARKKLLEKKDLCPSAK